MGVAPLNHTGAALVPNTPLNHRTYPMPNMDLTHQRRHMGDLSHHTLRNRRHQAMGFLKASTAHTKWTEIEVDIMASRNMKMEKCRTTAVSMVPEVVKS